MFFNLDFFKHSDVLQAFFCSSILISLSPVTVLLVSGKKTAFISPQEMFKRGIGNIISHGLCTHWRRRPQIKHLMGEKKYYLEVCVYVILINGVINSLEECHSLPRSEDYQETTESIESRVITCLLFLKSKTGIQKITR